MHVMFDAFVVLVCKPHHIDYFLDDRCLEKATTLVLQERPMLSAAYQQLRPVHLTGNEQTLNAKLAPSFNSSAKVRFFLMADLVWLLWKLNITSTRGQSLALSSPHT